MQVKVSGDFPLLMLHFIRTSDNLADYLTRQGMPRGDLDKLCLKTIKIKDFYQDLLKLEFTLKEWEQFCIDNPDYLMVNHGPTVLQITATISKGLDNIREVVSPLEILRAKFSRDIIIREKKSQYKHI